MAAKSAGVCFDFQKGKCAFGSTCRFRHERAAPTGGIVKKAAGICHAFQQGACRYGTTCKFLHSYASGGATVAKGAAKAVFAAPTFAGFTSGGVTSGTTSFGPKISTDKAECSQPKQPAAPWGVNVFLGSFLVGGPVVASAPSVPAVPTHAQHQQPKIGKQAKEENDGCCICSLPRPLAGGFFCAAGAGGGAFASSVSSAPPSSVAPVPAHCSCRTCAACATLKPSRSFGPFSPTGGEFSLAGSSSRFCLACEGRSQYCDSCEERRPLPSFYGGNAKKYKLCRACRASVSDFVSSPAFALAGGFNPSVKPKKSQHGFHL